MYHTNEQLNLQTRFASLTLLLIDVLMCSFILSIAIETIFFIHVGV